MANRFQLKAKKTLREPMKISSKTFGKLFFTLTVIVFLAARARFQNQSSITAKIRTGSSENTLPVNGVTRHYLLYAPISYTGSSPVALILNFHGMGASSLDEEGLSGMSGKAEKVSFIVVYPDGLNKARNCPE
jgi:poly(3-hydroxybutyrate) depolymerase